MKISRSALPKGSDGQTLQPSYGPTVVCEYIPLSGSPVVCEYIPLGAKYFDEISGRILQMSEAVSAIELLLV